MQEQLITQRLKHQIQHLENAFRLTRYTFGRCSGASYQIGYEWHSTKGVKTSAVYLYNLPSKQNSPATFALMFDFYDKNSSFGNKKLPLEEQTVRFSYCLNNKSAKKEVFKSRAFYLHEAREIIIKLRDNAYSALTPEKRLNKDSFIDLIEGIAFGYEVDNQDDAVFQANESLTKEIDAISTEESRVDHTRTDYHNSKQAAQSELEETNESLELAKLDIEIQKLNEKRALVLIGYKKQKKLIKQKHGISTKENLLKEAERLLKQKKSLFEVRKLEIMKQFKVSGRFLERLLKLK